MKIVFSRQVYVRNDPQNEMFESPEQERPMSKLSSLAAALQPDRALLLAATAAVAFAAGGARAAGNPPPLRRLETLLVPGKPLRKFDIGFVNAQGVYALADKSNHSLDFFEAATGRFLGRATGFGSGPHGVVAVGRNEFWAGDGDSGTVKVVSVSSQRIIASIATERGKVTDELTYDPRDHLVAVVSKHDGPPIINLISTRTRRLLGRVPVPQASDGAEQPLWDPASGLLYVSIPVLDHVKAHGAIAVIDPRRHTLLKLIPIEKCMPAGLALGPHDDLLVGCSDDAVAAGFPARSYIVNAASGRVVARLPQVGGSDEVYSDENADRYYLAAVANPRGAVLGVVDSRSRRWIANLPTGPDAHSVAADPATGRVFVPIAASSADGGCPRGCIAVYGMR
jgi:DNA-binding beta-propeller fold protein YncE